MRGERWTEERLVRAIRMWLEGWSASVVAAEIGVTRNAVIGKMTRLEIRRPNHVRLRSMIEIKRIVASLRRAKAEKKFVGASQPTLTAYDVRNKAANVRSGSHQGARDPSRPRQPTAVLYPGLICAPAAIAANSACASAISGISGVGAKPSSAGATKVWASAARWVDW